MPLKTFSCRSYPLNIFSFAIKKKKRLCGNSKSHSFDFASQWNYLNMFLSFKMIAKSRGLFRFRVKNFNKIISYMVLYT